MSNKERLRDLPVIIILTLCLVCSLIGYFSVSNELKELKGEEPTQDISMGLEIEKKWVINKDEIPYDLSKADCFEIVQTYINYLPEIRVRQITYKGNTWYMMALKRWVNEDALTREESDFYITKEEYENTVGKGLDSTIYKKRYQFDVDGLTYAVDIFEGNLEGLAYLEIEFESEELANSFETVEPYCNIVPIAVSPSTFAFSLFVSSSEALFKASPSNVFKNLCDLLSSVNAALD